MFKSSINKTMILCLVAILCVPLSFILPTILTNNPQSTHQEQLKKLQSVSSLVAEKTQRYLNNQQSLLNVLGLSIQLNNLENPDKVKSQINDFINANNQITALSYYFVNNPDITNTVVNDAYKLKHNDSDTKKLSYIDSELRYGLYNKKNSTSSVFNSTFSQQPVIMIKHHILQQNGEKLGTLLAEVDLQHVRNYCAEFSFGNNAWCNIVSSKKMLISAKDATTTKSLTKYKNPHVLNKLNTSTSGFLEYVDSSNEEEMLAGFAIVKGFNWYVVVTQAAKETTHALTQFKQNILIFAGIGSLLALILALTCIKIILAPINILVSKTRNLKTAYDTFPISNFPKRITKDIESVWTQIGELILALQNANDDIYALSHTSNTTVFNTVEMVRKKNLDNPRNIDHETGIACYDIFLAELHKCLRIRKDKHIGLITFQVTNLNAFKNEKGSAAATDYMKQIAALLHDSLRLGDMITRCKDSDTFIIYINNNQQEALSGSAKKLSNLIENSVLTWNNELVTPEIKTSLLYKKVKSNSDAEQIIKESNDNLINMPAAS